MPTEPKLNSRGWPIESEYDPPSRPEIKTVTGYMYNGEYYATEAAAESARIASKVSELLPSPNRSYSSPREYRYYDGWNDCVKLVVTKLHEINRIINL